jgi:hypothetical protein
MEPSALPHVGLTNRVPIHARRTVAFVPVASFRHFPNSGNEKLMIENKSANRQLRRLASDGSIGTLKSQHSPWLGGQ